jgi:hypothetical protein
LKKVKQQNYQEIYNTNLTAELLKSLANFDQTPQVKRSLQSAHSRVTNSIKSSHTNTENYVALPDPAGNKKPKILPPLDKNMSN